MKYLQTFESFSKLLEGKLDDVYAKYYSNIDRVEFNQILKADPTAIIKNDEIAKTGEYTKWLLALYKRNALKLEDLYKATSYLTTFDKLKRSGKLEVADRNIDNYKSLPDLLSKIQTIGGTGKPTDDESYLLTDRYFINTGEAEVYFEDEKYLIVIPHTLEASKFYAHDTEWCTQYPSNFSDYSKQGDLYIIINKKKINTSVKSRRVQLHFQSTQFMDMNDDPIKHNSLKKLYPIFKNHPYSIVFSHEDISGVGEGLFAVAGNSIGTGWGLMNLKGEMLGEPKYDMISKFKNGRAKVFLKGKAGFIDVTGKEVIPPVYDSARDFDENGYAVVETKRLRGMVNKDGKEIVPTLYVDLLDKNEATLAVRKPDSDYWSILDIKTGKLLTDQEFSGVQPFYYGIAIVNRFGRYGFINREGKAITPLQYTTAAAFQYNGDQLQAYVRRDGIDFHIDVNGNEVERGKR